MPVTGSLYLFLTITPRCQYRHKNQIAIVNAVKGIVTDQ